MTAVASSGTTAYVSGFKDSDCKVLVLALAFSEQATGYSSACDAATDNDYICLIGKTL